MRSGRTLPTPTGTDIMIAIGVVAALLLQAGTTAPPVARVGGEVRNDSTRVGGSISMGPRLRRTIIPVTPELIASAFRDPTARALITRARAADATQEATLQSYEATTSERMSVGARLRAIARDRLIARFENATRVRWQRGVGAHVEVLGSRFVAPVISSEVRAMSEFDFGSLWKVPYFPGRESLWPFGAVAQATQMADSVNRQAMLWVHPLSRGAEAYYRYSSGDSVAFGLPDGRRIRAAEIRLEPRAARWDLVVGSFWFDVETGHLVRAIYRPSMPMDLRADISTPGGNGNSAPWFRPVVFTVKSVSVEFALLDGRWWLPRRQAAEGEVQVTFVRVPAEIEQRFEYASTNGFAEALPAIVLPDTTTAVRDTSEAALTPEERARRRTAAREARETSRIEECARLGSTTTVRRTDSVNVRVSVPCDTLALVNSPALPASIFEAADAPLTEQDLALLERALGFMSQAQWALGSPVLAYGVDLVRYNRVEGLSMGAQLTQQFGAGFEGKLIGRLGVADLHPRGELILSRSDAWRTIGIGAYERLGVSNDWGTPLSFGASVNALLFGRDEGLYYRASGVELSGEGRRSSTFSWRVFGEQHRTADVETHFSLPHLFNGLRFHDNIVAARADLLGAGARFHKTLGLDPMGMRLVSDLRVEAATGDFDFARGMIDATMSRGLSRRLSASITGAAGGSQGVLPPQRLWYLGGLNTVRGQPIHAAVGNTFWMARSELGFGITGIKLAPFYDLGWAGDRKDWRNPGQPISGAGVGLSFLDSMFRFDVAKGIRPTRGWRVDFAMEARF